MGSAGEELALFSTPFRDAYATIMSEQFSGQDALVQLGVFRDLIGHLTSGMASIKVVQEEKAAELYNLHVGVAG